MYNASLRFFSDHIEDVDFNLCALNVYIGAKHIAYTLTENNRVVCFEKYDLGEQFQLKLRLFISENRWLSQTYQSVAIAVNSPDFHISPKHLDLSADLLDALHGDVIEAVNHTTYIQKHQLKIDYKVPKEVEEVLTEYFPTASIKPYVALAIAETNSFDGDRMVVHCLDEYYTIVLFKGNKLMAAKTVEAISNEKLSYLLLSYCKLFNIDKSEIKVLLSGWLKEASSLFSEIARYFGHVAIDESYSKFVCDNTDHEQQYFNTFEIISNS
jgi:hypothetical protein